MFQNGIGAKLASPSTKEWVVRISTGFRVKTLVNCGNPEVAEATGNCGRWGTLPGFWAEALGAKPQVDRKQQIDRFLESSSCFTYPIYISCIMLYIGQALFFRIS